MACRWLLLAGLVGSVYYVVLLFFLGFLWVGYDPIRDSMSELGAVDSPVKTATNVAGFMGVGSALLVFAAVLLQALRPSLAARVTVVLLTVGAAFMIVVGFFPCDPGCDDVTATGRWHSITSIPQAVALPLAAMVSSTVLDRDPRFGRRWAYAAFWTGLASLATGPIQYISALDSLAGLVQRVGMGLSLAWVSVLSWRLFRAAESESA